jgi:hypothetical protein
MTLIGTRTNNDTAVPLDLEGLQNHALIVGQSGSGKSFFVSRLVEEIVLHTEARVAIVDLNGDFRTIGSPSSSVFSLLADRFSQLQRASSKSSEYDTPEEFTTAWARRRFLHLYPNVSRLPNDTVNAVHRRLVVHWDALEEEDRDFLLRSSGQLGPRTLQGLEACIEESRHLARSPSAKFGDDLRGLVNAAEMFAEKNISLTDFPFAKNLGADDWYAVRANAKDLLGQYTIWWSKTPEAPTRPRGLSDFLDGPFQSHSGPSESFWDIITLSLDTVARAADALLVVNTALSRLWMNAKNAWRQATRAQAPLPDRRVPTFVVIDEAQNFAPAATANPLRRRVTEQLIQIAAEGRKYGLYLILATQRPTKLHPELVPECENSAVLRVQSSLDTEFASNALGIPEKLLSNARSFSRGQGVIAGRWIANDIPIDVRFAPARTVVGGGGLTVDWKARKASSPPFLPTPQRLHEIVLSELTQSPIPVTLVDLADTLRSECPGVDERWEQGHGDLKALLVGLAIRGLRLSDVPPGYAYLVGVHKAPTVSNPPRLSAIPEEVRPVLQELHQQTGAPLLDPTIYRAVFESLGDEVQERPFQLAEVSKAVHDRLWERNIVIGKAAINFIITGVLAGGHRYDPDLPQDPKALATAFVRNLRSRVQPRLPLEGADLDKVLSLCTGALLLPNEVAQVTFSTPSVVRGDAAVPETDSVRTPLAGGFSGTEPVQESPGNG